ncbi:uncharacterized protein LOC135833409 [Planococcus citri]|uniref:uncharacterized protein LOC135833409 n=1 Tax=Planococcus citri TaxID=170843 RepID=UPI0031FA4650
MKFVVTDTLFEHALQTTNEHRDSGPIKVTKIEPQTVTGVCTGLLSDVHYYRIHYTCDDSTYTKSLVVKIPFNKPCFEISRDRGYYSSEYLLYYTILPEFNKLLKTELTPKQYTSTQDLVVILDNLVDQGFANVDKFQQLNLAQTVSSLQLLARFQAASYQLNEIKPHLFKFYKRKIEIGKYVVEQLNRGFEALVKFIEEDDDLKPYLEYMKTAIENFRNTPSIVCRYDSNRISTLNHGDYWINNILFKETGDNGLELRMIDFQLARWVPPVFDIIKLIVCSVQFDVIQNHSSEIFQAYVDEFNATLKSVRCNYSYTIDQFYSDMKYQRYNYLVQIAIFLRALYALPESVVANESNNDAINLEKMFIQDPSKELHYKQRLSPWLKYFKETDIFQLNDEDGSSSLATSSNE